MVVDIFNCGVVYDLICADPPWQQSRGGKKAVRAKSSGIPLSYPTCTLNQIKEHLAQATTLTADNAVLFLWTIDKYLGAAEQIAADLGYKLHARMIWNKVTGIPAAFTIRFGHEYLLYMYKGKLPPVARDERGKIHSVFTEKATQHSRKPDVSYETIERLYPGAKRLEMYARRQRQGWDCWGNEV